MHYKSSIKELKSLSETREELKEYECMMERKHKYILAHVRKVSLYEIELENVSENEAIEIAHDMVKNNDIKADDEEIIIDEMEID